MSKPNKQTTQATNKNQGKRKIDEESEAAAKERSKAFQIIARKW